MRYDIARIIESIIYFIANTARRDAIYKTWKYKSTFAIIRDTSVNKNVHTFILAGF